MPETVNHREHSVLFFPGWRLAVYPDTIIGELSAERHRCNSWKCFHAYGYAVVKWQAQSLVPETVVFHEPLNRVGSSGGLQRTTQLRLWSGRLSPQRPQPLRSLRELYIVRDADCEPSSGLLPTVQRRR